MSNEKDVLVIGAGPIKDAAGLHGKDIGYVYVDNPPVQLVVDYALEHDGWVPITNPNPWKQSGKQGWIKVSRIAVDTVDKFRYIMEVDKISGETTLKQIG
jgi:hypothetical protein